MDKKKLIAILLVLAVIVVVIILLLQRCEPKTKPQEENPETTEETTETIDLEKYRSPFIAANIEFTCKVVEQPELKDDENTFKTILNEIFKKHTLPVDDDPLMVAILNKYENDQAVIDEIRAGAKECQNTENSAN